MKTTAQMTVQIERPSDYVMFGKPVILHSEVDVTVTGDVDAEGFVEDVVATLDGVEIDLSTEEHEEAEQLLMEQAREDFWDRAEAHADHQRELQEDGE